jgi:hypothetical protein
MLQGKSGEGLDLKRGEFVELARLYLWRELSCPVQTSSVLGVVGLDWFLPAPEELWRSSLSLSPNDPINKQRYGETDVEGKSAP